MLMIYHHDASMIVEFRPFSHHPAAQRARSQHHASQNVAMFKLLVLRASPILADDGELKVL